MRKTFLLALAAALAVAPTLAAAGGETKTKDKDKTTTTLTGCLSQAADAGAYRLKTKAKEVDVRGLDHLKDHVGHEVKLTGTWMDNAPKTGAAETREKETARTGTEENRHFMVTKIEHVAATCASSSQTP